jgi:hypothetical protein
MTSSREWLISRRSNLANVVLTAVSRGFLQIGALGCEGALSDANSLSHELAEIMVDLYADVTL